MTDIPKEVLERAVASLGVTGLAYVRFEYVDPLMTSDPAFPSEIELEHGAKINFTGLSRRDYFAAAAIQGLCSAIPDYSPNRMIDHCSLVHDAFAIADAAIKHAKETEK